MRNVKNLTKQEVHISMERSIKQKVNRIGLVGQIVSFILILESILTIAYTGYRTYIVLQGSFSSTGDMIEFILSEVISYASSILSIAAFFFMQRMATGFRHCDSPFEDDVIRRMKKFAWSLLAWSVVKSLQNLPALWWYLYNPREIVHVIYIVFTIVVPQLWSIIALSVLFLTKIFRYGADLQKQADETL